MNNHHIFLACEFSSSSSSIVGTTTSLLLSITTHNYVPSGGKIQIKTPIWDSFATDVNYKYYAKSTVTCTAGTSVIYDSFL